MGKRDIDVGGISELMPALGQAVQSAIITPGAEVEQFVRQKLGIPAEEDLTQGMVEDGMGQMAEAGPAAEQIQSEEALASVVPIKGEAPASITPEEASEMAGVSRSSIMNAIKRGQIPGARIGNTYRMLRDHFLEYMRGKRAA